jgi:hypothetical protein
MRRFRSLCRSRRSIRFILKRPIMSVLRKAMKRCIGYWHGRCVNKRVARLRSSWCVEKKNWCSYVPIDKDRLLLEVLSYADEVRALAEITVGEVALSDMEEQLAEQVIAGLSTDH